MLALYDVLRPTPQQNYLYSFIVYMTHAECYCIPMRLGPTKGIDSGYHCHIWVMDQDLPTYMGHPHPRPEAVRRSTIALHAIRSTCMFRTHPKMPFQPFTRCVPRQVAKSSLYLFSEYHHNPTSGSGKPQHYISHRLIICHSCHSAIDACTNTLLLKSHVCIAIPQSCANTASL